MRVAKARVSSAHAASSRAARRDDGGGGAADRVDQGRRDTAAAAAAPVPPAPKPGPRGEPPGDDGAEALTPSRCWSLRSLSVCRTASSPPYLSTRCVSTLRMRARSRPVWGTG